MANQEIEDNKIPVCRWMRRHYIEGAKFIAICSHCQIVIYYRNAYSILHHHLMEEHSEKLTEEQKIENKIHWTWDYFIPKANQKAICNLCSKIIKYHGNSYSLLINHLRRHRDK
ncbi:hypothetical protein ALC60_03783 [Trachymyrmex zeteki]|uniref:BED-type domain-containing protein n=1 Tax=Mycetomoellerius zeteki TaxID=64791 RepID=A0A151XA59_9HYME|nr:hypothetical protein ALC60_03783 [Trachymyrmex zeteki]